MSPGWSPPARPAAIILDLDGTLVDSAPDIANSANHALGALGAPERTEREIRRWVGNGARTLMARALSGHMDGEPAPAELDRALGEFLDHYTTHACVHSRIYPGVVQGLTWLRANGYRLACVTNKPSGPADSLLATLGLKAAFELVLGGDALPAKKPDPGPVLHAAASLEAPPSGCLVVGDSVNDVLAARAARMPVICTSYGYNHGRDIRDAGPDAVIDSLCELEGILA